MTFNLIELIGYAASITIFLSLTMKSMAKLRIINLVGCLLFIIYGLVIKAFPVVLLNSLTAMVNIYFLVIRKLFKK